MEMSFHGFFCNNLNNEITEDVIDSKWVRDIYRDLQIILRKLSHQKFVLFHRMIM